jgi:hypothetical protein
LCFPRGYSRILSAPSDRSCGVSSLREHQTAESCLCFVKLAVLQVIEEVFQIFVFFFAKPLATLF